MVNVVFAPELLDVRGVSVFLAGPTPRSPEVVSWRPKAILEFEKQGFSGTLLVPEDRSGVFKSSYDEQVEWEEAGLHLSTCIMFWVPRDLKTLPGLTTNDEWGQWKRSGKVTWGAPPEAEKVSYQEYYAKKLFVPSATTLEDAVRNTIQLASVRATRTTNDSV